MNPEPLPGDPAPAQLCALLEIRCVSCGNSQWRWRPIAYAEQFGAEVDILGLRCEECGGCVRTEVDAHWFRIPDGPVKVVDA
jgi:hypothetical protein